MQPILPQPTPSQPGRAPRQPDRVSRVSLLAAEDAAAGLLWLAMNFPGICDAMLDKLQSDDIDDEYPGHEPEPFCAECGSDIGIFLRYGLDWRHYRANGTTSRQIELTDPGHDPVVAWRLT